MKLLRSALEGVLGQRAAACNRSTCTPIMRCCLRNANDAALRSEQWQQAQVLEHP